MFGNAYGGIGLLPVLSDLYFGREEEGVSNSLL